jgi:hypothetical protein
MADHKPAGNSQSSNRALRAEVVIFCKSSKAGVAHKFALSFAGIDWQLRVEGVKPRKATPRCHTLFRR